MGGARCSPPARSPEGDLAGAVGHDRRRGYSGFAQTPAPPPTLAPPLISLAEARVIIDGAVAFTRDQNLNMAVVVVDAAGNLVSADKMDGTTINNTRFAEGKAFASAILRQTTEVLANLAKERPDRYFGIMNMYPGKVYLVGGGVPLTVEGRLVGAVGVAGLPQGIDEKAARAAMPVRKRVQNLGVGDSPAGRGPIKES